MQDEQDEHSEVLSWLIDYMGKLEKKLHAEGWSQHCPTCWPCESHPQSPTIVFLNKLKKLFQFSCINAGIPKRRDCPSPAQ